MKVVGGSPKLTAYKNCFPNQRLKCYYETEEHFVYFGIKINPCTANPDAGESSLMFNKP